MTRSLLRLVAAAAFVAGAAFARDANAAGPSAIVKTDADAMIEEYRAKCAQPLSQNQAPLLPNCDQLLYEAAVAYRNARLTSQSLASFRMLIDHGTRTGSHSTLEGRAIVGVGEGYRSLAVYDLAAEWLERAADLHPAEPATETALSDAVILRLGLGQEDRATRDADRYVKLYGATHANRAAAIVLAIAEHHAEHESWDAALNALATSGGLLANAPIDVRVRAHALRGRAMLAHAPADRRSADAEYEAILALWGDGQNVEHAIEKAWPDEDETQRMRRLGRAINAEGEALFVLAERQREAVRRIEPPIYAGPRDETAIAAHVSGAGSAFLVKKRAAIEAVAPLYIRILDIRPVPPPRWVIAAAASTGAMWADLASDVERLVPRAKRPSGAPGRTLASVLEQVAAPIREQRAKPAMAKCMSLAINYQWSDERSRACDAWLVSTYPREYHAASDLAPVPRLPSLAPIADPVR